MKKIRKIMKCVVAILTFLLGRNERKSSGNSFDNEGD